MKAFGKSTGFLFLLISLMLSFPLPSSAADTVNVTDIRFWSYPEYTRVVISLTDQVAFSKNRLSNPDRLYFDLKNSRIKTEIKKNISVSNEMLKSVRAAQFDSSTVRVVLDLEKITDYKIITLEDPVRLIIDIYGQAIFSVKKRIVIDAGHGGHDPGAVGANKLYEKDVVLDIAMKLRDILAGNPNYEVFLTRDRDVFIPLEQRTAIANSKNADLFVSVHANASPRRAAKGIETYMLNWTTDEESMKVAARENAISLKKMRQMNRKEMDILDIIKSDLSRENKRDESIKLAHYIQKNLVSDLNKNYNHIVDLGVKQALFYVLFGAKMPSVLVEVSFISNLLEEKLLSKDDYRGDLAKSISEGIAKYMAKAPEGQTVAGFRKDLAP
ncbi:MAG: N-acetylmuramoyl-L-alanine amidase [Nitrospira bacterium HGW-Nitrospira-1]|nr:MAG: N-acetylmuramoyl-L-alanine amidase [Nitrospira bacterium HGW-Nitrospira-1]